ncbi:hypothetical protein J1N35_011170 [Gossypium stocksii]|uniref:Uncharacterized protein n=1 Tax=Gossypium stocksii TaxID=47602 RepID=A0A9D3W318_9ROSI|nr:hypothetical protein J1N35_011170 [Gossypium stocksii]
MLLSSSIDIANENGKDTFTAEDSYKKKVHFKDTDAGFDDVMVVDPLPVPPLSWKDKLLGNESLDQDNKIEDQSATDNFFLSKQDVKKSIVDGVPFKDFSDRVY